MEYYSTIKRNEIGSFVETWVEPEPIIQSKSQKETIPYDITYIWNLKNYTNELMYKTKIDSQV